MYDCVMNFLLRIKGRYHLERHSTEAPDVGGSRVLILDHNLRRHVGRRAHRGLPGHVRGVLYLIIKIFSQKCKN